jgi:hypothetical protein
MRASSRSSSWTGQPSASFEVARQALHNVARRDLLHGRRQGRDVVDQQLQTLLQLAARRCQVLTEAAVRHALIDRMVKPLEKIAENVSGGLNDLRSDDDQLAVILVGAVGVKIWRDSRASRSRGSYHFVTRADVLRCCKSLAIPQPRTVVLRQEYGRGDGADSREPP